MSSGTWGVIACGALAADLHDLTGERGWDVEVVPLPALLHNRPAVIADEVAAILDSRANEHDRWAVAYADCGTYGALDDLCAKRGLRRLAGAHCYDVYAGADRIAIELEGEPGTYFVTDFLVQSFHRSVIVELGLDRFPDLRDDYFGHYRRVVWLAGRDPDDRLGRLAREAAAAIGLPLEIRHVGRERLAREVEQMLNA